MDRCPECGKKRRTPFDWLCVIAALTVAIIAAIVVGNELSKSGKEPVADPSVLKPFAPPPPTRYPLQPQEPEPRSPKF